MLLELPELGVARGRLARSYLERRVSLSQLRLARRTVSLTQRVRIRFGLNGRERRSRMAHLQSGERRPPFGLAPDARRLLRTRRRLCRTRRRRSQLLARLCQLGPGLLLSRRALLFEGLRLRSTLLERVAPGTRLRLGRHPCGLGSLHLRLNLAQLYENAGKARAVSRRLRSARRRLTRPRCLLRCLGSHVQRCVLHVQMVRRDELPTGAAHMPLRKRLPVGVLVLRPRGQLWDL